MHWCQVKNILNNQLKEDKKQSGGRHRYEHFCVEQKESMRSSEI
jgi:hypothetical protein